MISQAFLTILLSVGVYSASLRTGSSRCQHEDSACIVKQLNEVFHSYYNGYPDFHLRQFEPLMIPKMSLKQDGIINVDLAFKNVALSGLSKATVYKATGFKSDPQNNKLEIRLRTPALILDGPYKATGNVLFVPITAKGMSNLTLENIDVTLKFVTKKIEKNGKIYMNIEKKKVSFESPKLLLKFTNKMGTKEFEDTMNNLLNASSNMVMKEVKPSICENFGAFYAEVINEVLSTIPYCDLFAQ